MDDDGTKRRLFFSTPQNMISNNFFLNDTPKKDVCCWMYVFGWVQALWFFGPSRLKGELFGGGLYMFIYNYWSWMRFVSLVKVRFGDVTKESGHLSCDFLGCDLMRQLPNTVKDQKSIGLHNFS